MTANIFRGRIDAHAPFNAYQGYPPAPARPIPITEGENVDNWKVDSQGQIFNYKIIHNLNLDDPSRLVVQVKYVFSYDTADPVIARLYPVTRNDFVVQTYGLRAPRSVSGAEYEVSCGFIFEAELF